MNDLLKVLFGGLLGFGVAKLIEPEKKEIECKDGEYYVFVRTDEFSKSTMQFDDYEKARNMYYKLLKAKKVVYKELVDNSEFEKDLYEKSKTDKDIPEEERWKLTDEGKISQIAWGKGQNTFEEKEF
ncbi:MAG: hypothetical protein Q7R95_03110 [bacterium]|nr:hypothetical protein [bacterium]